MNRRPAILTAMMFLIGCVPAPPPPIAEPAREPEPTDEEIALEELAMEDTEALDLLIMERLRQSEPTRAPGKAGTSVPAAAKNWALSPAACLRRLDREGVHYKRPTYETPGVRTPLLVEGPVEGVTIAPRWPKSDRVNAVMDCHLVLALVEVAKHAGALGINKIEFYSTYRPVTQPPKKCPGGGSNAHCRRLKKAFQKARRTPSQHSAALAIDIRWLTTRDGETIDVLEDYDRRSRVDPCSYQARGERARLLQDLACALHKDGIFNVILTPNANKAHHNHFHFDITPDAAWTILR